MTTAVKFDTSKIPAQRRFMESTAKELMFSGAFGASKSRTGCEKGLFLSLRYPGNKGLIIRKTFASLRYTTMDTFFRYTAPPDLIPHKYNQETHICTLENGSEVIFLGLDDPLKIGSLEVGWIFIDEVIELDEDEYIMLLGRLRLVMLKGGESLPFRQIFMATNPASPQHYLYRKFFLENDPDREVVESNTLDNPYLPDDYKKSLLKLTGRYKERYVYGKWIGFEGLVYDHVDVREIIIPSFDISPHWKRHCSIDFGYCVDEETEILTKTGWKTHHTLQEGDITLTINPIGLSEWAPVEQVSRFEGSRDMISMEGTAHSSLTTPNHRWLIWPRNQDCMFKTTEELKLGDAIPRAAPCHNVPISPTYSDSFVELVAWLWTEGNHQSNGAYALWQSEVVNSDNCKSIEKVLVSTFGERKDSLRFGSRWYSNPEGWWTSYHRKNGDAHCGTIQYQLNKTASQEFTDILGPDKEVSPAFITQLTKDQLSMFLEISLKADGSQNHSNGVLGSRVIGQKVRARLDSLQIVCCLLGIATTLRAIRDDKEWNLTIFKAHQNCLPIDAAKAKGKFSITRIPHDGIVWCPTTANGTWLARRNGTVYFTGNTNPFVYHWWCEIPKEEERDDLKGYYLYREIYYSKRIVEIHAARIKVYPEYISNCYADWDAEDRATLEDKNILTTTANKAVGPGIQTVYELLGEGRIHIFDDALVEIDDTLLQQNKPTCTAEEFGNYRWSDARKDKNDRETPQDKDNHGMDAMRYLVHSLLSNPEVMGTIYKKRDITPAAPARNWGSLLTQRNWKRSG